MLTLRFEVGESVMIGDDIMITVIGVNKRREVQLSFDAPRDIAINREKLYNKLRDREKQDARRDPSIRADAKT